MNRPVSYAMHIQGLFTESQRQCMLDTFDLKKYEDVKEWCDRIASRLKSKSMPADDTNPWPDEWIAIFTRWIAEGCQP